MFEDPDQDKAFPTADDLIRVDASAGQAEFGARMGGTPGSGVGSSGGTGSFSYSQLLAKLSGSEEALQGAEEAVREAESTGRHAGGRR